MINEKSGIDEFMNNEIKSLGVKYYRESSGNIEVQNALKSASKRLNGNVGKPEFTFFSKDFFIVVEDKNDVNLHIYSEGDTIVLDDENIVPKYAVNGAIHYAKHIINHTHTIDKAFAIGASGNGHSNKISIYYVDENEYKFISELNNLNELKEENIEEFYRVSVLGELPKEERELKEVNKIAADLHEDLRNYGSLEGEKKASVVSAILLALENEDVIFSVDKLQGLQGESVKDGEILFDAIDKYLRNNSLMPHAKIGELKDNFNFIQNDLTLNRVREDLGMTPLKYFTIKLDEKLKKNIKHSDMDILGNFYGEFVKYGGSDGNSLGIVLTPRHITNLMCDLIDINENDYVLDPCCGSGGFLIAAMNKMLEKTNDENKKVEIKQEQLHGIELQQKLFTIATTNMILRGDGKSNLKRDDIFHVEKELYKDKITKALINPPYSQAKTKNLSHLSEISFINETLSLMKTGSKLAAIVPQSTMIGKTKNDKNYKREILENHSLDTVITLNKDTFYGVGVNPCITIFTAGVPQDDKKRVNFINFSDDGYVVRKHVGLVGDGTEKSKKEYLLNVLNDYEDADTNFLVKSSITWEDEWLHSFFYYNEEIPTDEDFEKTIADYLSFEFDMKLHGRGYLFDDETE
ncbi:HsdM family class I SAM-dependent methyltransferase [Staphylococcus capitis]|uniref:HsdM family class I SAM-dependent methyltransferase n=1 Tax=Staphylococcus capitis TaxID=29388 RepID=UPI00064A3C69|nr:N-6 DNA methylase [Staphylococcus capitis]AKL91439.1 Restriction enzyme BgcI subunit alpha [Staphylococcus capitis subsp. capitis]MCC0829263.1 SAM-dependent methyltransferase [Staphylococcus capitis]MCC3744431.1 SAM-dependent methyltransferase [Staphylococcus capitis]MCC9116564.1 SAM-dependent methyltransferase [Staphylococcus capitis]MCC9142201.1 SAM-dependent methyltransferase [Staphylococcus capitis]